MNPDEIKKHCAYWPQGMCVAYAGYIRETPIE